MRRLYFRCRYGHFISDGYCPIDGWTHAQIGLAVSLFSQKSNITIEELVEAGIAVDLAERAVIIETMIPHSFESTTVTILKAAEA